MTRGRELAAAVLACAAGAGVALLAAGRDWASARAAQGDLRAPVEVTGTSLAPSVQALAIAALAGAAAVLATRGVARRLAGLVLLACGTAAAVAAVRAGSSPDAHVADLAGDMLGAGSVTVADQHVSVWPWVTAAGCGLVALAGVAVLVRGGAWPSMGSRYDAPSARRPEAPPVRQDTPLEQWKALDRGEDPTAD